VQSGTNPVSGDGQGVGGGGGGGVTQSPCTKRFGDLQTGGEGGCVVVTVAVA
jgi:hypothetical protein